MSTDIQKARHRYRNQALAAVGRRGSTSRNREPIRSILTLEEVSRRK